MRRAWLVGAGVLLALACLRDTVGPGAVARFSLAPVFETGTAGIVDFDRLRVTLTPARVPGSAVDTTIVLAATAESVVVDLRVQISGPSQDFVLVAVLLNAAGQEVFRAGPVVVTLRLGGSAEPVVATFRYTGTGADAAAVRIRPPWSDTTLFFNDSLVLVADALDSAGRSIAGTPIRWTSLDPAKLVVRRADSGLVVAASQRGLVPVEAALLTGQKDSGTVTAQPRPSALGPVSGDGQGGVVGTVLAESLVVRLTGPDGLGVRGVLVAFAAGQGGIVDPALAPTDASGRAAARWTLGPPAGSQAATAAVAGVSPVSFTATATLPPAVVFAGDSLGGRGGVFRVNPDGTDLFHLDTLGRQGAVYPRSSPDRKRVAFSYTRSPGGTNELFVVARTGDTSKAVVSDTSTRRPRWSPDGVHLAFECGDGFSPQQDVCVMPDVTEPIANLDGNGAKKVFVTDFDPDKLNGPGSFAWDPMNPSRLVVVRDSLTAELKVASRLWTVSFDGTNPAPLSPPTMDLGRGPLQIGGPIDIALDGGTLVFAATDTMIGSPPTLYVINRDGTGLRALTKGTTFDARPVFSPDVQQVVFVRESGCSFDYWRVDVASGTEEQVSAEGWCDFNSSVIGHDWSPDGKDIVLVGSEPPGSLSNFFIYRVPAGTTAATYTKDRVRIGRAGQVVDIQPSWRP